LLLVSEVEETFTSILLAWIKSALKTTKILSYPYPCQTWAGQLWVTMFPFPHGRKSSGRQSHIIHRSLRSNRDFNIARYQDACSLLIRKQQVFDIWQVRKTCDNPQGK